MREIAFDTETTGLDPTAGHRIVEIGGVELYNHVPTGRTFHRYLNPGRSMPAEAAAVHGLTTAFLADKPRFADVVDDLLSFLGDDDAPLVIHNAAFDIGFLNAELRAVGRALWPAHRAIDTVEIARKRYPGAPASLDALCRRYQIDLSDRTLHGALKDAELLAQVYLELLGGREPSLGLATGARRRLPGISSAQWAPRVIQPNAAEEAAHRAFVGRIPNALWLSRADYAPAETADEQSARNSAA